MLVLPFTRFSIASCKIHVNNFTYYLWLILIRLMSHSEFLISDNMRFLLAQNG